MSTKKRGQRFEAEIGELLTALEQRHPGLVEVVRQPTVLLLSGRTKRPDFELIYRIDQEHRELIECQSRKRSSAGLAAKIKLVKALSARNRFLFIFEDLALLSDSHRQELEEDGVQVLSVDELGQKLRQIDIVLSALQERADAENPKAAGGPELTTHREFLRRIGSNLDGALESIESGWLERVGSVRKKDWKKDYFKGPS